MRIIEVDGSDEGLLRAWHAVYLAAETEGQPYAAPWQLEEVRADLTVPTRKRDVRAYAGLMGDAVVCAGQIGMPLLDNRTTCTIGIDTELAHRRRGYGAAMLGHLVEVARGHDRSRIFAEVSYPYDAPPDGRGETGPDFVTARGFAFALGDVCRVLDLPAPDDVLQRLAADAEAYHRGYRIETFSGPVPERWLAGYVALDSRLTTDSPMGELGLEPQAADVDAHREFEELIAAQGRLLHHALALDPGDRVVGYTTIGVSRHDPGRGYQWGTLVDPAHRGHRLGLALKAANVARLQSADPTVSTVLTWNAEANRHMVAVNDDLGHRPVGRLGEFQLVL